MFARVASFEGGDTEKLRESNQQRMQGEGTGMPEGVKRILVLNDEGANRRLFITFFDSEDELRAAEPKFDAMGNEIGEEIRGRRTALDVYEVVFDEAP